ncbi:MAG: hypothetical protein Q8R70_04815, partial [Methanoregula sp.]|nr:hypothetical protein [Methanoregula sp.]
FEFCPIFSLNCSDLCSYKKITEGKTESKGEDDGDEKIIRGHEKRVGDDALTRLRYGCIHIVVQPSKEQ